MHMAHQIWVEWDIKIIYQIRIPLEKAGFFLSGMNGVQNCQIKHTFMHLL